MEGHQPCRLNLVRGGGIRWYSCLERSWQTFIWTMKSLKCSLKAGMSWSRSNSPCTVTFTCALNRDVKDRYLKYNCMCTHFPCSLHHTKLEEQKFGLEETWQKNCNLYGTTSFLTLVNEGMLASEGCRCSLGHKPTRNGKQIKNNKL